MTSDQETPKIQATAPLRYHDTGGNLPAQQQQQLPADPGTVAAAEAVKAWITAGYLMAKQAPRNEDQARQRILKACRQPRFARRAQYSKPVGSQKITGPSIRFAEMLIREWRNIRTEALTVYEDQNYRRVRVTIIDLETNTTFSREIQVRKTVERKSAKGAQGLEDRGRVVIGERKNTKNETVYIVWATDEELAQKESSMISKVVRNEGLRLIPSDIVDEGLDVAQQTLHNKHAEDPDAYKKAVTDAFAALSIMPADLEHYIGHSISTASAQELEGLRCVYQAIKDGDATWADYLHQSDDVSPGDGGTPAGASIPPTKPPTEAPATEPDDWELLAEDPNALYRAVYALAAGVSNDMGKQCSMMNREGDWPALVNMGRMLTEQAKGE